MALKALFDDIAAAIREKEGSEAPIVAERFPARIRGLTGSGGAAATQARTVEAVAAGQLKLGDTVYTLEQAGESGGSRGELPPGIITGAQFSPDGKLLVLTGHIDGWDGWAKVYDVTASGTLRFRGDLTWDGETRFPRVRAVAISPDGKRLVLAGAHVEKGTYSVTSGWARVYAVNAGAVTEGAQLYADAAGGAFPAEVEKARFTPGGDVLVLWGYGYSEQARGYAGGIYTYGVTGEAVLFASTLSGTALTGGGTPPGTMAMRPDGTRILAGWRLLGLTGTTLSVVKSVFSTTSPMVMAFSPDASLLLTGQGSENANVQVYTVSGDSYVAAGTVPESAGCTGIYFSPDGRELVLTCTIRNYSATIQSSSSCVRRYAVSGSAFTPVQTLYEAVHDSDLFVPQVTCAAYAPGGDLLVLGGSTMDSQEKPSEVGGVYTGTAEGWTRVDGLYGDNGAGDEGAVVTAYPAAEGVVPVSAVPCGVGWALEDVAQGGTGRVTLIATVKEEATRSE